MWFSVYHVVLFFVKSVVVVSFFFSSLFIFVKCLFDYNILFLTGSPLSLIEVSFTYYSFLLEIVLNEIV